MAKVRLFRPKKEKSVYRVTSRKFNGLLIHRTWVEKSLKEMLEYRNTLMKNYPTEEHFIEKLAYDEKGERIIVKYQ